MAPPDVPDGEVDGEVIGAGVVVFPAESGLGPQAPSANRADRASERGATDLREASDIKIPFKRVTANKNLALSAWPTYEKQPPQPVGIVRRWPVRPDDIFCDSLRLMQFFGASTIARPQQRAAHSPQFAWRAMRNLRWGLSFLTPELGPACRLLREPLSGRSAGDLRAGPGSTSCGGRWSGVITDPF